jgi:hypothetical protein
MFFILGIILFLTYGSGAGASSEKAILSGKIAIYFAIFPPIIYNIFKMYFYKKLGKADKFNSNLITGIFMSIFVIFHYYIGFLGS